MSPSDLLILVKKSYERRVKILQKKGHDYSTTQDTLINFKRVGQFLGVGGKRYCLNLIALKLDRLINLMGVVDKKPKNESLRDTIDDMKNYLELLEGLLVEEENAK